MGEKLKKMPLFPVCLILTGKLKYLHVLKLEAVMIMKKIDFSEVHQCVKLRVNFHPVAVRDDTSCTIRLLAKFEFPARASNKTRLKLLP